MSGNLNNMESSKKKMKYFIILDEQQLTMALAKETDTLSSLRIKLEQPKSVIFLSEGSKVLL